MDEKKTMKLFGKEIAIKTFVISLLILVLGVGFAIGGYYLYQGDDTEDKKEEEVKDDLDDKADGKEDPYEGWQTYKSEKYGLAFRYPASWDFHEYQDGLIAIDPTKVATQEQYETIDTYSGLIQFEIATDKDCIANIGLKEEVCAFAFWKGADGISPVNLGVEGKYNAVMTQTIQREGEGDNPSWDETHSEDYYLGKQGENDDSSYYKYKIQYVDGLDLKYQADLEKILESIIIFDSEENDDNPDISDKSEDGEFPGYIKKIYEKEGKMYLDIDYVQVFDDPKEAMVAYIEDRSDDCDLDVKEEKDVIAGIKKMTDLEKELYAEMMKTDSMYYKLSLCMSNPVTLYFRNENPKIRTFEIASDLEIVADKEPESSCKKPSLDLFKKVINDNSSETDCYFHWNDAFHITVKDGVITKITANYLRP